MEEQRAIDDLHLIERQHAALGEAIEELQEVSVADLAAAQISACRLTLLTSLGSHMKFEEELMKRHGYPLTSTHTIAHRAFRDQFNSVIDGIDNGVVSAWNISSLLQKVLKHHEINHDDIFGHFLIDKYFFHAVEDGSGI
ncbi:MAG: hemerythrin domain-containing protein [Rhodospirillaceae bacterium]